jgi:cellulose synthase/poly-beta-1,6-N-acetylglucosamine synthase-like glycosyltransferase
MTKVSVIVPIYNGEADLPGLIDCLKQQTYPGSEVEYLLVDNNSSDRTAALIAGAVKETLSQDIHLHHLTENQIQSSYAARNRGIRAAKGQILAFTDVDCRPHPDWLEQLWQSFAEPQVGIVVGEVAALPGPTLWEKYAQQYQVMSQRFLIEHPFCPYGQTANLALRRSILEQVGLFRPYLTTGGDADICWRILGQTDWQLRFNPQALVYHRHRSNLKDFRSQWRRYGSSNRYLHELHNVDLMRELTFQEALYSLSRWLLKELPRDSLKVMAGRGNLIDLIKTPIDLIGFQARSAGQRDARLPELAAQIEWL